MTIDTFGAAVALAVLDEATLRERLAASGETEVLARLDRPTPAPGARADSFGIGGLGDWVDWLYPYRSVTNIVGFFAGPGPLMAASRAAPVLAADVAVNVLLERLNVYRYPGFGTREILLEATIGDRAQGSSQKLMHFARKLDMLPGTSGVLGWPLFQNVKPAANGLLLACQTLHLASVVSHA